MNKNVTIYKAKKSVAGGGLVVLAIVFFGLTLPLIIRGETIELTKLLGLAGFWIIGIILSVLPLGAKLEVGDNYITTYLFGFVTTPKTYTSDIQTIIYGNLFYGGLGFGKGITYRALINEKSRAYSIGESVYGKEAVMHAKKVLEKNLR